MRTKVLIVSYNGLSHTNANGKTLYALLSAFDRANIAQFFRGNEFMDFTLASSYFHVTDREMLKSLFCKFPKGEYEQADIFNSPESISETLNNNTVTQSEALSSNLRKYNYNFWLRWIREILWCVSPWGKRRFWRWLEKTNPQALVYMGAESIFEDKLVLKICKKKNIPLIVYNCEGYRLIQLNERHGIERLFYKCVQKSYTKIHQSADLVIYNCPYIMKRYHKKYGDDKRWAIAYNAAAFDTSQYLQRNTDTLSIVYFGNLGVGRVGSLLEIADYLKEEYPKQKIDVYGRPSTEDEKRLTNHPSIILHGFVSQEQLLGIRDNSDILLHVESFDPKIVPKLKNAFSTKIAQCLCSGRCLLTYAPIDMASTEYLIEEGCACVTTTVEEMREKLKTLIDSFEARNTYAELAKSTALKNHDLITTARNIRNLIGELS